MSFPIHEIDPNDQNYSGILALHGCFPGEEDPDDKKPGDGESEGEADGYDVDAVDEGEVTK